MSKTQTRLYECIESFGGNEPDGSMVWAKKGQLFREDDPILKRRGHLFRLTEMIRPDVESATAAPGERR